MAKRVWRKFLGLDVGEKRIGMSLASEELVIAIPYGFLDVNNMESAKAIGKILTVVLSEEIDIIVVGRPRNNEGLLTAQTVVVEQFIKDLKSALKDLGKKKGRKLKGFVEELEIKYSESDLLSFQEADMTLPLMACRPQAWPCCGLVHTCLAGKSAATVYCYQNVALMQTTKTHPKNHGDIAESRFRPT